MIWTLVKLVFVLAILGAAGLAGYAQLGDLTPEPRDESFTVILDDG